MDVGRLCFLRGRFSPCYFRLNFTQRVQCASERVHRRENVPGKIIPDAHNF